MDGVLPPVEQFLGGGMAQYAGEPNVNSLPTRDRRTPGTVVGRMHTTPTTVLNIVDSEGRGFPVDLAQIDQDRMAHAVATAGYYGDPTDAAVATFHQLASHQRPNPQPRSPAYNSSQVTTLRTPAQAPIPARRRAVPMVGQPEPVPVNPAPAPPAGPGYVEQGMRPTRPNLMAPPQSSDGVGPPTQQVTYEIPNYGPLDTFYHQVIRSGGHLILVFDKRHVGQRGFPRHNDNPLGMRIHGTDNLFMVQTTGIEFELDSKALCLLQIMSEGSYTEYVEQSNPLARSMNAVPFPPEASNGHVQDWSNRAGGDAPGDDIHDTIPGF
jgi:hypothetical protein